MTKPMTAERIVRLKINHVWSSMRDRCNNINSQEFPRYGGRGIKVCVRWNHSFNSFFAWSMSHGYKNGLSIDRIKNNRGYSPTNCRWATDEMQMNNTRRNVTLEYHGQRKTIAEWGRALNIDHWLIRSRINKGWSPARSLSEPRNENYARKNRKNSERITFNGETKTFLEWAGGSKVDRQVIYARIRLGWSAKRAITTRINRAPHKPIVYLGKTILEWQKVTRLSETVLKARISNGTRTVADLIRPKGQWRHVGLSHEERRIRKQELYG